MSVNRLYDTWCDRIKQLRPTERITRIRNMAWLAYSFLRSAVYSFLPPFEHSQK